jgi:hypothetical protein
VVRTCYRWAYSVVEWFFQLLGFIYMQLIVCAYPGVILGPVFFACFAASFVAARLLFSEDNHMHATAVYRPVLWLAGCSLVARFLSVVETPAWHLASHIFYSAGAVAIAINLCVQARHQGIE